MALPHESSFELLKDFLQANPTIEFIRYQWLDMGNILKVMILTKQHALELANKPLKMSCVALGFTPINALDITSLTATGNDELYPDWESLRVCTYVGDGKAHASVMCFIQEKSANFAPWKRDPRSLLKAALQRAKDEHGMDFLVGFEVEFRLKSLTNPTEELPAQPYGASTLRNETILAILEDSVRALQKAGVYVSHFHAEGGQGGGTFEIPTGPLRPLEAVDALVFTKETIVAIARKHGYSATCFPKPLPAPSKMALGAHVHFSIDNTDQKNADHFLAGLLGSLPAMCAFSLPNIDSYHRLGDSRGTMGSWVGWGVENKDVAVRQIINRTAYWEIRCADQTANMYFTLAAWITAGCEGVKSEKALKWKGLDGLLANLSDDEVAALNWEKLPTSLGEAIDCLEAALETHSLDALGTDFLKMYIKFKRFDLKTLEDKSEQERLDIFLGKF